MADGSIVNIQTQKVSGGLWYISNAHRLNLEKRVTKKRINFHRENDINSEDTALVAFIKANIKPPLLHSTRYHLNLAYYGGHYLRPTSLSHSINAPSNEEDGC